jgi:hypothetical protein
MLKHQLAMLDIEQLYNLVRLMWKVVRVFVRYKYSLNWVQIQVAERSYELYALDLTQLSLDPPQRLKGLIVLNKLDLKALHLLVSGHSHSQQFLEAQSIISRARFLAILHEVSDFHR